MLLHGLRLLATRPAALLWTYALNLGIALLFSMRLHAQMSSVLDHSLGAERLNSAFDLGTLAAVLHRLDYQAPSTGAASYMGLPLYLLCYFVLVPGTLASYRADRALGLSGLAGSGLAYFWRFVRITLLTGLVSALVLGPLLFLNGLWTSHVDDQIVGAANFWDKLPGAILILVLAAALRLYFDLVEVYTVQAGDVDRRVRRALLPALRTLGGNFGRAYGSFVLLALIGLAAVFLTGRVALHTLAQPRVWPMFLLLQLGFFLMLATRFWQRAAETVLAEAHPRLFGEVQAVPAEGAAYLPVVDALSDPEPAAPSLEEPDPGVFHHDPPPPPMPG